ncbi:hypothetical protein PthBH41_03070 [Parageobacillus thermoglucosidasius]|nr:UTP--glucose-1-phosphate uridylyltransferase [Anoxybacillus flavithermus]OAO84625.1 UTP--glucose-1-phosphate uridylyltransferase [Parageobacillus thermoglucosidasius]BDG30595.1 hypothetical protein PthBH41_03070 [Parageobacillus thermoglucosidasius]
MMTSFKRKHLALKQFIDQYEQTFSSVIGVKRVPDEGKHCYGIIAPLEQHGRLYQVRRFVEKQALGMLIELSDYGEIPIHTGIFIP